MTAPCTPFFNRSGGFGITGSPSAGWTFTRTAQASTAETPIVAFGTSDGSGSLTVENASATDAIFSPRIRGVGQTTGVALNLTAQGVTDTGTNGVMQLVSRISTSTVVATRPMFEWLNHSTSILSLLPLNSGANSALSWGTQTGGAPTFTTRSVGTRVVYHSNISGSSTDVAQGYASGFMWSSCWDTGPTRGFRWFGGTTQIAELRGDGLLTTTGGRVKKYRIALTSPVTIAVTDDITEINLTTPGAVTINYPATPETGREYVTIDGKGDAGANNHTHTPAAGNINGAGTVVAATNYYRGKASYNGTQWLFAKEVP